MTKAEQFVYLDPFNSFSLRQDHNSSLACQFLHATARPDTRIFLHSPSLCIPNVFQPLLPFPLICLFSFFPFHSQQTSFFLPPISLPLLLFSLLPFTLSFPLTLCFCWGCLLSVISSKQTHKLTPHLCPSIHTHTHTFRLFHYPPAIFFRPNPGELKGLSK